MKKTLLAIFSIALVLFTTGCKTTETKGSGMINGKKPNVKVNERNIIDYQGATFGGDIPQWVIEISSNQYSTKTFEDIMPNIDDKKVFVKSLRGDNQDTLKTKISLAIKTEVASSISQTVGESAKNFMTDDPNAASKIEDLQSALININLAGLEPVQSYWVQIEEVTPKGQTLDPYYEYYSVYAIDKKLLKEQVNIALDKIKSEENDNAELKEIVNKSLDVSLNGEEVTVLEENTENKTEVNSEKDVAEKVIEKVVEKAVEKVIE